ncbi:MAG: hypothetical protein KC680_03890 [Candidatus Peregrinibacteria bacterium]|nr:hypothetical protein [Candidatus Peregrinibacteria bacterium]MCB9808507.1 hypothetical protein [Candidatus Peribacteria bacterium]
MKRLLAISLLTVGLLPSIPVLQTLASVPSQEDLTRHCRDRLGFGQTEPIYGSQLLQLRRCIDNTRSQYEKADQLLRRAGATHYAQRYDQAQTLAPTGRETQRSLNERVLREEQVREEYYNNVSLEDRDDALEAHRLRRRAESYEQQLLLLRDIRSKQAKWKRAVRTCVYYPREQRQECVYLELNAPE